MRGIPFIVSAPSGAGKTTLCNMAVDFFPDLRHSISYTTRSPRQGERDGVEYRFVDEQAFLSMIEQGEFLEHALVHGQRYGTAWKDVEALLSEGLTPVLDIDVQGAGNVRRKIKGGVYIFILPPSLEVCEQRLKARAKDAPDEIIRRIEVARGEIKHASEYDYIIINDRLDEAFAAFKSIIIAERLKKDRMAEKAAELFKGLI